MHVLHAQWCMEYMHSGAWSTCTVVHGVHAQCFKKNVSVSILIIERFDIHSEEKSDLAKTLGTGTVQIHENIEQITYNS